MGFAALACPPSTGTTVVGVDADAELARRRALTEDAARADKVAQRHAAGGRTARENVAALLDPGSFVEYGRLASAAQEKRLNPEELLAAQPRRWVDRGDRRHRRQVMRGPVVRLPGDGRHPGHPGSPQVRPTARADRAAAAAGGVLRRGWRWSAHRHGLPGRVGTRRAYVRPVGGPFWAGAPHRGGGRSLLRGQRGDRRVVGHPDRHSGRHVGGGWSGDGVGGGSGGLHTRAVGSVGGDGRQRRDRRGGR
jgi:hypothetical protein